jgi:hypothetical protein
MSALLLLLPEQKLPIGLQYAVECDNADAAFWTLPCCCSRVAAVVLSQLEDAALNLGMGCLAVVEKVAERAAASPRCACKASDVLVVVVSS